MSQVLKPKKGYKSVPWLFGKEIEIPEEWEIKKLEQILEIPITDGPHLTPTFLNNGIPFISVEAIKDNRIDFNYSKFISVENHIEFCKKCKPQKNDILLVKAGSTTGKVTKVEVDFDFSIWSPLALIRINMDNSFQFYYCFVQSNLFQKQIKSNSTFTTQPNIGMDQIKKLLVVVPPINQQQKIATILSNVDSLIESTSKIIKNSKSLKTGLMQKLLTRGIGHSKFKKVPWLFGKEIEIPEEWEVLPLSKICNIRETDSIKSDLYVGLEHISQNDNKLVGQATTKEFTSNTNSFHNNDVLYGKLRPLLNKVWLATEDGHCSTDILPLQTKDNIIPTILLLVLTDYRFFWYAVSTSSGTKMPRTNWLDMKNFLVFLPSVPEQQKIASILSNIDAQINSQTQYKDKLERLKKSLMQKLLTGEVRV